MAPSYDLSNYGSYIMLNFGKYEVLVKVVKPPLKMYIQQKLEYTFVLCACKLSWPDVRQHCLSRLTGANEEQTDRRSDFYVNIDVVY